MKRASRMIALSAWQRMLLVMPAVGLLWAAVWWATGGQA